jgi:hypothetical protein
MKLNAIIAVEKNIKSRMHSTITELDKAVQQPALFNGGYRQYLKKNDDDDELPSEKKHVQRHMADVIGTLRATMSDYLDIMAHRDVANAQASSEVWVGGKQILPKLPSTALLQLEKNLNDMRVLFERAPLLDSSEEWSYDENAGLYRSEPTRTTRTKKTSKVITLAPPTDRHPAQAQLVAEDVVAGIWETTRLSGALPKTDRDEIIVRIDVLIIAVKEARERANEIEAGARPQVGAAIFEYLLRK